MKRAVIGNQPDGHMISVSGRSAADTRQIPLGELRDVLTVTPGQKVAYVTDVSDTPENRTAIVQLVRDADLLFIEATFADAALAASRAHLTTTTAAGRLARAARVQRVEPFHFSPRYEGQEQQMLTEVMAAFLGRAGSVSV